MLKNLIKSHSFQNENWSIKFHENGVFHEIYPLKNYKRHGTGFIFFTTGILSYILSYKNDKIHENLISLHSNYCVSVFSMYKDGKHLIDLL